MCYKYPGPRCASHTRARLDRLHAVIQDDPEKISELAEELEETQLAYDATPEGRSNLEELIKNAVDDEEETVLKQRLKKATRFWETRRGAQRIIDVMTNLPNGGDIYSQAKRDLIVENALKYPYVDDVNQIPEDTKSRIISRARAFYIEDEELILQGAISSPVAWISSVLPLPERQNYQERALYDYLTTSLPNDEIDFLQNRGITAKYLINGKLETGFTSRPQKAHSKSLDFFITTEKGNKIAVAAKYTVGTGGSQDNQGLDAERFIAQQKATSPHYLALILDGDYYQTPYGDTENSKLDVLKQQVKRKGLTKNTFVGSYKEFITWKRRKQL